jgi:L-alanine-DL-glutamate epimerase-like enolase superfamily enzyme
MSRHAAIRTVRADAWEIPTDGPEADGTFHWDNTTLVVVRVEAGGRCGLGYTYAHRAVCAVVAGTLSPLATGRDAFDIGALHADAIAALRNAGHPGIGAMAVSAFDVALWDLKARLLGVPLPDLFATIRDEVPVYGSGGFTTYDDDRLREQLAGWVGQGIGRVKIKIGSNPADDPRRVALARDAIGDAPGLMVDANGACDYRQALALADAFADARVDWLEEPVPSDDLRGLRMLRERMPAPVEIAAGEYGWDLRYFERMLAAGAVDVMQADATRCGGYTGFLAAATVAHAHRIPLSAHTAPALHAPVATAAPGLRHLEYFHDHVRLERLAFDGVALLRDGVLVPDRSRPGHGLTLREADLERYRL